MSYQENDNFLPRKADFDGDNIDDSSKWPSNTRASASPYDRVNYTGYPNRPAVTNPVYQTTATNKTSADDTIIYTRSAVETEKYLDEHGITLCKSPEVIRRTVTGKASDYEQRICLRYLQPPPLPKPGPLTIEEVRKPTVSASTLVIREQEAVLDAPPPLVLRERPPTPPVIPGPEKKTVIIPGENIQHQSVVIERHLAAQQRPRDIVIERWLPYGPVPEREVIVKRVDMESGYVKPTCTIVNYEYPQGRLSRKFVVVDVYNADPNDYMIRYSQSLLNSSELVLEARRAGVTEDISSPSSISVGMRVEKRSVDYRQSRDGFCDCFSSGFTSGGVDVKFGDRSGYSYSSRAEASSTIRSEY